MINPHTETDDFHGHIKKPLLKIIREKCLDCCTGKHCEVRKCHITSCPLWPYRMGKNPFHNRAMTDENKHIAIQHLKKRITKY